MIHSPKQQGIFNHYTAKPPMYLANFPCWRELKPDVAESLANRCLLKSKMEEPGTYNGSSQTDKIKIRLEGTPEAVESAVAVLCITMEILDDFEMNGEAAKFVRRYITQRGCLFRHRVSDSFGIIRTVN